MPCLIDPRHTDSGVSKTRLMLMLRDLHMSA
nr:MAG TPA: hypothetical protein [Caudoviricetes sp.]DAP97037.1 MAG TPA: hypothetical protein [Caudoviricetes sp.]